MKTRQEEGTRQNNIVIIDLFKNVFMFTLPGYTYSYMKRSLSLLEHVGLVSLKSIKNVGMAGLRMWL